MPTPLEHYETAEDTLKLASDLGAGDLAVRALLVAEAQAHATLAAVPWARDEADEVALGLDREQVAALVDVVGELASWARLHLATLAPGVPDDEQEPYLAGWNNARERVLALVDPVAREVLER